MKVRDLIGKEMISSDFGRVLVISVPKKAKTTVEIQVIQRGPGWDDVTETYKRYRMTTQIDPKTGDRTLRWGYTKRDEYGRKELVHVNTLKPLSC